MFEFLFVGEEQPAKGDWFEGLKVMGKELDVVDVDRLDVGVQGLEDCGD